MFKLSLYILPFLFIVGACNSSSVDDRHHYTDNALKGSWLVEYIDGYPVIDRSPATIIFGESDKTSGNTSCNNLMSSYQLDANVEANDFLKLTISPGAVTRKMCLEVLMRQEQRYLQALPKVTRLNIKNGMLYLFDESNNEIIRASSITTSVK